MVYCLINDRLCQTMQRLSEHVWEDSDDAIEFGYPLHEETISQMYSLRLNRKMSPASGIKQAPNETKNGADWIWIIHDDVSNRYVAASVQAKRLHPTKGTYDAFNPAQVSKIIDYSAEKNFIPLHVFFNHSLFQIKLTHNNYIHSDLRKTLRSRYRNLYRHVRPFNLASDFGTSFIYTPFLNLLINNYSQSQWDQKFKKYQKPLWKLACRCGPSNLDALSTIAERLQLFRLPPVDISDIEFPKKVSPQEGNVQLMRWLRGDLDLTGEELFSVLELDDLDSEKTGFNFVLKTQIRVNRSIEIRKPVDD